MKKNKSSILSVLSSVIKKHKLLSFSIIIAVAGSVIASLLSPLVLEKIINNLTDKLPVPFYFALLYFALIALTGLLVSAKESTLIVFGQKVTKGLRRSLCRKLSRLPAKEFVKQEPGVTVSRFVNDVDTVENLFTSGIISMFADFCKIISIFSIIFFKNTGLALLLLVITPLLFSFTRVVQKRMLKAQLENRVAVGKVNNHVPETIRNIRMIRTLHKEKYMRQKYDEHIQESYAATEKTNFYDAVYSPVILIINALVVAVVMILSATGNPKITGFFGMSVGTAVAIIAYIGKAFEPLESIGMEIQTIQSAVAGVKRIEEFLSLPERWETDEEITIKDFENSSAPCVQLQNVTFGYEENNNVLNNLSFTVNEGEHTTLTGRTGAGKSTIFKLLLGMYKPDSGEILIYGKRAETLPDSVKRHLFGYVEQNFRLVPGTVLDQITLFDDNITREASIKAAETVGLNKAILKLENGYDTVCAPAIFSQGQYQLLSIARAIAAEPKILLLDEITANLDAETEQYVLDALKNACENRTVISISHRLYEQSGGRKIEI